MENYIVRIYRCAPNDADKATGTLESVGHETVRPFHAPIERRSIGHTHGGYPVAERHEFNCGYEATQNALAKGEAGIFMAYSGSDVDA